MKGINKCIDKVALGRNEFLKIEISRLNKKYEKLIEEKPLKKIAHGKDIKLSNIYKIYTKNQILLMKIREQNE